MDGRGPAPRRPAREILIPNGRPTIVICLGEPGNRIPIRGKTAEPNVSNSAGLLTQPILIEQRGVSRYVGAQLKPWGLKAFGLPPLVDAAQPLIEWLGARTVLELEAACGAQAFGRRATQPLQDLLEGGLKPFPPDRLALLRAALCLIDTNKSLLGIDDLLAELGIGYDALYRLFRGYVGVPLKQFLSIMRFYHFSGELLKGRYGSLALLASLQGYYDQAHATREFRRFAGISQGEFRHTLNGIAKLMHGAA
jgi:AraC-like DNA-binding protein